MGPTTSSSVSLACSIFVRLVEAVQDRRDRQAEGTVEKGTGVGAKRIRARVLGHCANVVYTYGIYR